MSIPGYTADVSVGPTGGQYWTATGMAAFGRHVAGVMAPAMPVSPDPCAECNRLFGCARSRCFCVCNGGDIIHVPPSRFFPCGFECV